MTEKTDAIKREVIDEVMEKMSVKSDGLSIAVKTIWSTFVRNLAAIVFIGGSVAAGWHTFGEKLLLDKIDARILEQTRPLKEFQDTILYKVVETNIMVERYLMSNGGEQIIRDVKDEISRMKYVNSARNSAQKVITNRDF
jgi:hypothetical protein